MCQNPQFPMDLVTFTEEIFNKKLHLFCSVGPSQLHIVASAINECDWYH